MNVGNKVLLIGDLNAKHLTWNCNRNNKRGKILFNYTQQNNCSILFPDEPTHYPYNGTTPTIIDIVVNKNINYTSDVQVLHELCSDHNPIIIELASQYKDSITNMKYDYDKLTGKTLSFY